MNPERFRWANRRFRLFISHQTEDVALALALRESLSQWAVHAFVAHEDIEPGLEWETTLLQALRSCDALLALVSQNSHASPWCDQEVGFAMGRQRPVVALTLGTQQAYGLMARVQSLPSGDPDTLAVRVLDALRAAGSTASLDRALAERYSESASFADTRSNRPLLEGIRYWTPAIEAALGIALATNVQINRETSAPRLISWRGDEHLAKTIDDPTYRQKCEQAAEAQRRDDDIEEWPYSWGSPFVRPGTLRFSDGPAGGVRVDADLRVLGSDWSSLRVDLGGLLRGELIKMEETPGPAQFAITWQASRVPLTEADSSVIQLDVRFEWAGATRTQRIEWNASDDEHRLKTIGTPRVEFIN